MLVTSGKQSFSQQLRFWLSILLPYFLGGAILRYFVSVMSTRSENNSGNSRKSAGNWRENSGKRCANKFGNVRLLCLALKSMITNDYHFFRNFATLGFQGSRVQSDAICRSCIAASNLLPSFDGVRSPEISPLMDDRLSRSPAASEEKSQSAENPRDSRNFA